MMDIGEESFRMSIIPFIRFISYIPISPFSYTKDLDAQLLDNSVVVLSRRLDEGSRLRGGAFS